MRERVARLTCMPNLTPIPNDVTIKRCPPARAEGAGLPTEYGGGGDRSPRYDAGYKMILGSGPIRPF